MITFKQNLRKRRIFFGIITLLFSTLSFGQTYYLRGDWVDGWSNPHIFSSGRGDVQQVKNQTAASWNSWEFLIVANGYNDRWDLNGIDWNGVMTSTFDNGSLNLGNSYTNSTPTASTYYCINIANTGYSNQEVALIQIGTSAPQTFSSQTLTTSPSNASVDVTMSASLSSEEKLYIVYRNTSSSNWKKIEPSTSSGSTYTFSIPRQDQGSTVEYFVMSTSNSMSLIDDQSEAYYNLRSIEHLDNSGSAFSYTQPTNTWDGTSWSSTFTSGDNVSFGADYTVSAGSSLEVGSIEVSSGYTLTIDASSSGYGQLKASGSITNNGTIIQKQYIGSTGHHGISSPMSAGFGATSGTASALYEYDAASSGVYVGSYVNNGTATTSTVGRGFFAPVGNAGDFLTSIGSFTVTGTPNTSHDWTLSYVANSQSGASDNGWNLIGNPYSATLDWSTVSVGSNVNGAVYVWDPSNSQYMSWTSAGGGVNGGSQYIPPMQAFWVQTTSGGTGTAYDISTTMSSNTTTSQSPTFQKTQNDRIKLSIINLSDPSKNDETVIAHSPGSVDGFDEKLDAWKLNNYGGNPNLYSFYAGDKLAVNVVDLSVPKVIPLSVDAPQSKAAYQLYLNQEVNGDEYEVILEDKHLNTFTDLTQGAYSFQYGGWNNSGPRFNLHINGAYNIGLDEEETHNSFVYQKDNEVFIHTDEAVYSKYELWTMDGRLVHEGPITTSITHFLKPNTGLYMIQLKGNHSNKAIKTFLK